MKARGKNYLLVTGTLEIMIGLVSILSIVGLLMTKNGSVDVSQNEAVRALGGLLVLYAIYGLHILGGLLGVIFADRPKHSVVLMIFGFLLILMQIYSWTQVKLDGVEMIINAIVLLIPCYYFYGAALNYQSKNEKVARPRRTSAQSASVKTASSKAVTKPAPKKTTTKKASVKKATPAKKTTATKKVTAKPKPKTTKTAAKKATPTKKVAAKKPATTKKVATKKASAPAKKAPAKRTTTTKKVAAKTTAKKPTPKKTTAAKKPATKKVTKKTTTKRTTTKKK